MFKKETARREEPDLYGFLAEKIKKSNKRLLIIWTRWRIGR